MRPAFSDEAWLPSFFIASLFDVCSATENRWCLLTLMDMPDILQRQYS
jgi:hypothetical protein